MNEITVVITGTNRPRLLKRTLDSFKKFNTYPLKNCIYRNDVGENHVGQIRSCELLYEQVKTPFVFHCEDDWEFTKPGFIEHCFDGLEDRVHSVWCRSEDDFDGYNRVRPTTEGKYVVPIGASHGFSFNPHLYNMKYYDGFTKSGGATPEDAIGLYYLSKGLKTVWVPGYCHHIG